MSVSDPYFRDIRKLWKTHYPSKLDPFTEEADGLEIIADFAMHFPEDAGH
jgi:hypothetical protein